MEPNNKNLSVTSNQNTTVTTNNLKDNLAVCVFDLNQVRKFPLSDAEIEQWSVTILRLMPDVTEEKLSKAIDRIITGELPWDPEQGIRNIFIALNTPLGYSPQPEY